MYQLENPTVTASGLLSGEFENFHHNPINYLQSMNWKIGNNLRQWLNLYSDNITYTKKDVDALEKILIEIQNKAVDALDIAESGHVSDFLTNCIAGKINKVFDVLKDKLKKVKTDLIS